MNGKLNLRRAGCLLGPVAALLLLGVVISWFCCRDWLVDRVLAQLLTDTPRERCFQAGYFVEFDDGVQECLSTALQGDMATRFHLAELHYHGEGMPRDLHQAFRWYLLAALQGHVEAQYNVAWMYQQGEGVPVDPVAALAWYEVSAWFNDLDGSYYQPRDQLRAELDAESVQAAEALRDRLRAEIAARTGWQQPATRTQTSGGS